MSQNVVKAMSDLYSNVSFGGGGGSSNASNACSGAVTATGGAVGSALGSRIGFSGIGAVAGTAAAGYASNSICSAPTSAVNREISRVSSSNSNTIGRAAASSGGWSFR